MGEVEQLREELREVRRIAEGALYALVGRRMNDYIEAAEEIRAAGRYCSDTALFKLGISRWTDLEDREIVTLEDAAARPRDEVAAIDGVGARTMEKLDAAIAERGLSWREAGG